MNLDLDQLDHLKNPRVPLKISQWIFNLITWALIVSVPGYDSYKNAVYATVVFILFWLLGIGWVFLFVTNRGDHSLEELAGETMGELIQKFYFGYQVAASFLTFTAACAIGNDACVTNKIAEMDKQKTCFGQWQAATVFAFLVSVLHCVSVFFAFKKLKNE